MCTDIVDGILATGKRQVGGYGHIISNKRDWTEQDEWSNCFIKNGHKISANIDGCSIRDVTRGDVKKALTHRVFLIIIIIIMIY